MHGMSTKEVTSQRWLMFSKFWLCYNEAQEDSDKTSIIQLNEVFTNHSEDDDIYPLTVTEIVDAQKADNKLKEFFKTNATLDKGLEFRIIEDQNASVTKEGWSYPSLCTGKQRCGTTTISSTWGTPVLKRR
jgi:hypothetical protein